MSKQNDAVRNFLEASGADASVMDRIPTVSDLLAREDNPFEFIGELAATAQANGRLSQVFTDRDVQSLKDKGYTLVPKGVEVKGVPGGQIMWCPTETDRALKGARKARTEAFRHTNTKERESFGGGSDATYTQSTKRQPVSLTARAS